MRLVDRLGGHLVSGHIDGIGEVVSLERLVSSWNLELRWKDIGYSRYICDKASICVDGASLTIAKTFDEGSSFSIAVIPHTWSSTSLRHLKKGDFMNIEFDLMAKYAENLLATNNSPLDQDSKKNEISREWLENNGWF